MSNIFYVNNLGHTGDLSELKWLFTTVGDVESLRLESFQDTNLGFGVVEMKTEQQAIDCIERFHMQIVNGQTLVVSKNRPKLIQRRLK